MKQKLTFVFLLCFVLGLQYSFAQQTVSASGNIVSEDDGEPLIGAAVQVKGTLTGTTTDINGNFSFNVPQNAVLEISYIGMITQEVAAGPRKRALSNVMSVLEGNVAGNGVIMVSTKSAKPTTGKKAIPQEELDANEFMVPNE